MYSHSPIDRIDAEGSFVAEHRRFRRARWYWLVGALLLYATVESAGSLILQELEVFVHDYFVDWSVAVLIAVAVMIRIGRQEDHWVAQIAALKARCAASERALMQLHEAQTTVRTFADTIKLSLATIRGATELYREVAYDERNDADLAVILIAVDQLDTQVRHLLEFSHELRIPLPSDVPIVGV